MEENNFILVCDSAYGTYYISKGSKDEMDKMQKDIDKYSTGTLRVVEYSGDDLEELIDNVVEFDKKFKMTDTEKVEESMDKKTTSFKFDDTDEDDDLFDE